MKQRITISLDEDQAAKFDQLIAERGYENRSEAFRDLIRAGSLSNLVRSALGRDLRGRSELRLQPSRKTALHAPHSGAA